MKERLKWFRKFFKDNTGDVDPQFIQYQEDAHKLAFARAFELLCITEEDIKEQSPIVLLAPEQLDAKNQVRFKIVATDDETTELIYDQSLINILMFGEGSLYYYQANIDYRFGLVTNDFVGELNYLDIMNVETSFEYDDLEDPLFEIVEVSLWLYDGSVIPFTLRFRLFNGVMEDLILSEQEKLVLTKFNEIVRNKKKLF